jgi:hypothetical protein
MWRAWPMLSANTVAQKPCGSVSPPALQTPRLEFCAATPALSFGAGRFSRPHAVTALIAAKATIARLCFIGVGK